MKLSVGVMLTSFGVFWVGEGAGVNWPGRDLAILVLVAGLATLPGMARRGCGGLGVPPAGSLREVPAA